MLKTLGLWKFKLGVCCHGHDVMGISPFYGYRSRPDGFVDVLIFDPLKKHPSCSYDEHLGWRRVHPVNLNLFYPTCRNN